ncbi:MAG: hypothetical protein ACRELV_15370 [Longimicrobiales bacterium]
MADQSPNPNPDSDSGAYPGAPRWVKVFLIILVALVLLFVIVKLAGHGGPHGPGRHLGFGDDPSAPAPAPS